MLYKYFNYCYVPACIICLYMHMHACVSMFAHLCVHVHIYVCRCVSEFPFKNEYCTVCLNVLMCVCACIRVRVCISEIGDLVSDPPVRRQPGEAA